ncbi:MAG: hypothetical protein UR26_C0001G0117 [candidate division TM6 bacterium GW2011_GWF2_32_72]|nr:MAG: hypothetical protein UR26_C0001G0117 [candidate division TM6 bacterium GW2011_GWF2_32_72]
MFYSTINTIPKRQAGTGFIYWEMLENLSKRDPNCNLPFNTKEEILKAKSEAENLDISYLLSLKNGSKKIYSIRSLLHKFQIYTIKSQSEEELRHSLLILTSFTILFLENVLFKGFFKFNKIFKIYLYEEFSPPSTISFSNETHLGIDSEWKDQLLKTLGCLIKKDYFETNLPEILETLGCFWLIHIGSPHFMNKYENLLNEKAGLKGVTIDQAKKITLWCLLNIEKIHQLFLQKPNIYQNISNL